MVIVFGCNKSDEQEPSPAHLQVSIQHRANDAALERDTMIYRNAAGQLYTVNKLEYYISNFRFTTGESSTGTSRSDYVRDSRTATLSCKFEALKPGVYDTLRFCVGVPPDRNTEGGLPSTLDNINMIWPESMGGGYHFLRLEGHYNSDTAADAAFAVHLGKHNNLVHVVVPGPFVLHEGTQKGILSMDVDEWWQTPYTYDLTVETNYTMSDSAAMHKIAKNGKDAWHFRIVNQ